MLGPQPIGSEDDPAEFDSPPYVRWSARENVVAVSYCLLAGGLSPDRDLRRGEHDHRL